MNTDDTLVLRPEVTAFLEEVRRHLADLDDDTRDELLGGLEADLTDQVADGAELGDPGAYAAELRAAAGLPPRRPEGAARRHLATLSWSGVLDGSRDWFLGRVMAPGLRETGEIIVALRPVWWVARAWLAVSLIDVMVGGYEAISLVPTLAVPGLGELLLLVAIVLSTLIGMGRLWPGSGSAPSTTRRTVLLAGNMVAIVVPSVMGLPWPAFLGHDQYDNGGGYDGYSAGYDDANRELRGGGLRIDGREIRNIFAYDASGKPIDQVQLYDESGLPIAMPARQSAQGRGAARSVGCAALNGDQAVANSYPLAQLLLPRGLCTQDNDGEAREPRHPLATVPPVTPRWPQEADPVKRDPKSQGRR